MTKGSNKLREREFAIWDTKNGLNKLKSQSVDCGTSVLTASYDVDTEVLFVTGRVRYQNLIFKIFSLHVIITLHKKKKRAIALSKSTK